MALGVMLRCLEGEGDMGAKGLVESERSDVRDSRRWLRAILFANATAAGGIGVLHLVWPGTFARSGQFAALDPPGQSYVFLATAAIGLLLLFVAGLALYFGVQVAKYPRVVSTFALALGWLWTGRLILELIYPARIPLVGIPPVGTEDPHAAIAGILALMVLITLPVAVLGRGSVLGPSVVRVPVPERVVAAGHLPVVDYADTFWADTPIAGRQDLIAFAREAFGRFPFWLTALMRVRDAIAGPLGLRTIKDFPLQADGEAGVGGRLGFEVLEIRDDEVLLGETDKHLTFRVSLLHDGAGVSVTTLVEFHNRLGRLYFVPVGPAHRLVVPAIMRRAARRLRAAPA
jgi:hypothetical protein